MRTFRTVAFVLIFVITCFVMYAQAADSVIVQTKDKGFLVDLTPMKTQGNWSYVPINLYGRPDKYERHILTILETLESLYSYEIISFQIEKEQKASGALDYTYGIWVHHIDKTL